MQFITVRSKEKDYDIYLKSEKLVHSQQQYGKNVSQLFGSGKNWSLAISSLTNTVADISREKKVDPCYQDTKKCSAKLLGARKKIMTFIQSEKLVHSQQEHGKNVSQLFGSGKNWSLAISSLTNTVADISREKKVDPCYQDTKKCSAKLLGARKKIMTSIQSEKLVHSQQEHGKNVSQLFGSGKNWSLAISSLTNTVADISREKKVDPCYLETKKVVHNPQKQGKRL